MNRKSAMSAEPYGSGSASTDAGASPEQELERLRRRLRASEERSCEIQRVARIGLWEWNLLTNEDFWSEELYRLFGEDPETFQPSFDEVLARVAPEHRERVRRVGYSAIENRGSFEFDFEIERRDGVRRRVHSSGRIKTDETGRVTGMLGTMRDITEQWETESRLRTSEARLREAQRMSKLGNWERNVLTGEIWWSDEALRIFGLDRSVSNPTGDAIMEAVHPDDRKLLISSIERMMNHGETHSIEYRVITPDGTERIVHDTAKAVCDGAGRVVMLSGTVQDITKRKRIEQALRRSEFKYRTIVDTAHEGILVIDREHRITYVNRRMAQMLGYTPEEMLGRSNLEFMEEEARQAARRRVSRRLAGLREQYEFGFLHREGSVVWTRIAATPISAEDGAYVGSLLMVADITEPRRLERELRQAHKMEAVGQLTGGIARDFDGFLKTVIGNLESAEPAGSDEALRGRIRAALDAAQKGADLTRRLLAFARRQRLSPRVASVNDLIRDSMPLLKRLLGAERSVVTKLVEDPWPTMVDTAQLQSALLHVAENARDAMSAGGTLTIETHNVVLGDDAAGLSGELPPGDYVLIAVRDDGVGIPKDVLGNVFDPFFSTKATGEGNGLGLSMVYGFVSQSDGDVSIYSEEGQGTVVKIHLPRAADA